MQHEITLRAEKLFDSLSLDDLIIINRMLVERIKLLRRKGDMDEMTRYKIGETVSFNSHGRMITGRIIRFNLKSVSILTDDSHQWNVSPGLLLRRVEQER
ncbi:MAG: hypothetical protein Q8O74_07320 [bacterium]|nr:hypothetical protein [bacterium]